MGGKSFDEQFLVQNICSLKYCTLRCKGGSFTFPVICLPHNIRGDRNFYLKLALFHCNFWVPGVLFRECSGIAAKKIYNGVDDHMWPEVAQCQFLESEIPVKGSGDLGNAWQAQPRWYWRKITRVWNKLLHPHSWAPVIRPQLKLALPV